MRFGAGHLDTGVLWKATTSCSYCEVLHGPLTKSTRRCRFSDKGTCCTLAREEEQMLSLAVVGGASSS